MTITAVHDWATVYVDGKLIGKLDRRRDDRQIEIPATAANARLDILVEGMGRVNFGEAILDRKGITEKVVLTDGKSETELKNWSVYNFPVDYAFQKQAKFNTQTAQGPAWYKANFNLNETGITYLDMSKWGKGMLWINGNNLGRFWKIGPTQTLCVPACWLKKGDNEIVVLDLDKVSEPSITGLNHAILDKTAQDESLLHRKAGQTLNLKNAKPVAQGRFEASRSWKTVSFKKAQTARYFCFEALSAQDSTDFSTSVAEFEMIGTDGKSVSSLNWKVVYADSEEVTKVNNAADKIFDLQESVPWQTQIAGQKTKHPHQVVVDMGAEVNVKGFRILPRLDKSNVGIVKDYRFFVQKSAFQFSK